jgi:hypothetical protein
LFGDAVTQEHHPVAVVDLKFCRREAESLGKDKEKGTGQSVWG